MSVFLEDHFADSHFVQSKQQATDFSFSLSFSLGPSVQPARNLQTFGVDKRRVSYTFTASTTPGASYKVTFQVTANRTGITPPATQVLPRAGFRTISGLTPDVNYTLQVVAVRNGAESAAVSADFTTLPDGKIILPWQLTVCPQSLVRTLPIVCSMRKCSTVCVFSCLAVPSGPPQNLRVSSRTTTSITVTWSDPAPNRINDRDGVTEFVVKKNGVKVATVRKPSPPSITFTGLRPAESYAIEVLAVNHQGTAPPNHTARLTATTASGGMHISQLNTLLPHCLTASSLPSLPLPFAIPCST